MGSLTLYILLLQAGDKIGGFLNILLLHRFTLYNFLFEFLGRKTRRRMYLGVLGLGIKVYG